MKTKLLVGISLVISGVTVAQNRIQTDMAKIPSHLYNKSEIKPNHRLGAGNFSSQIISEPNPLVMGGSAKSNQETVIGRTTYDLQTNGSIQNRTHVFTDQTISAVWTTSNTNDLAASDRGTGYNHFNGTSWLHVGSLNYQAIETQGRTGWPSIFPMAGGTGEAVIAHSSDDKLVMSVSSPKGSGTFTSVVLGGDGGLDSLLWPRVKSSGNKIHMFALTIPTANQGAVYAGLDGAVTYSRSTDGGVTWDIVKQILPGMTAADGFYGFSGDSYALDVKGDTVVFLIGDQWYDTFIMKSVDGGNTFTKHMVWQNPMQNYNYIADTQVSDWNNDGIIDTILANDGSMMVTLDNNGIAHCIFGQMRGLNETTGDGNSSYFPFTDGLCYWNENMPANDFDTIGFVLDLNNDTVLNVTDIGTYFLSMASMPSTVIDQNNHIYVTYSAVVEDNPNAPIALRNIYGVKSTDLGATWSEPVNLTPSDIDESVFGALGNRADNFLHLVYQRDQQPSLAVRGDEHPFGVNEIVYLKLFKDLNVSTAEHAPETNQSLQLYPNPAKNSTRLAFNAKGSGMATASITNMMGQKVGEQQKTVREGQQFFELDLTNIAAGMYLVSLTEGNTVSTVKLIVQ